MSMDDVLIATTVSGMFLAVAYIGVGFRESLRQRSLESQRRELAGKTADAATPLVEVRAPEAGE